MGIAAAAGGAAKSLKEILAQRVLEQYQAQQIEMEKQRLAQDAAQFDTQTGQRTREFEYGQRRDTAADEIAAQARRQAENERGQMMQVGDAIQQQGMTPEVRKFALSSLTRIGKAPAGELLRDPEAEFKEKKRASEYEHQQRLAEIAAQGAQTRQTAAAKTPPGGPSLYSQERVTRTRQTIGEILGKKQPDGTYRGGLIGPTTTGWGSLAANVPTTEARRLRGKLKTLGSAIAFGELTEMREASKTGGALGQVAVRELELLESALGALDQGLEGADLQAELEKIQGSLDRWDARKQQQAPMPTSATITNPGGVPDQTGMTEYDFVNGQLVPRQKPPQ